ncbi:FGGY-family carbohydrate kinase [Wenxinia marina]|uniref:Sugar (Pentulose and hexulose) kinase n=1 Tax=Wenxinia marina DSM 24838 TaxID=1123501 RepID=A0A0D0QE56_9RHOB|nr:FGGY-family carbohydrate kinase [Wenxinia marina]KIQ69298.1 Sugar (pentulose and hexulose) kinase [Wenxinia marina DSM 24838]GGL71938.1 carbohydrate kinase [Wenxinia marina]
MRVAVVDVGKTNAKVALVDTGTLTEVAVRRTPNLVQPGPPWPHFDLNGLWDFILGALAELQAAHGVDAISVTAHGASAVLLDAGGGLAAPMLDYEHDGPDGVAVEYDAIRPPFEATGSPRLPMGLNLGAQLHWQLAVDPGLRDRVAQVVTYPQYWSGRLTGVWRCEATSLGCHTDLWEPVAGRFSALKDRLGLPFAPLARADNVLGPVLPEVAARTGLLPGTPVVCGIHDSNASLYPHLLGRTPPFAVVSTGTWVISMAVGSAVPALDPARDTLINVAATGAPVPSARFMGGREFERVAGEGPAPTEAEVASVLSRAAMLLPAVEPGSGPFAGRAARWTVPEVDLSPGKRTAAASFYLAGMTATCLRLTGAEGPVVLEGPMAANRLLSGMLAAATGRHVIAADGATGTSIGSVLLVDPRAKSLEVGTRVDAPDEWADYADRWVATVESCFDN